jgi:hypothetical protein
MKQALYAACILLISCLAYSSNVKMETIYFFETLVNFHQTRGSAIAQAVSRLFPTPVARVRVRAAWGVVVDKVALGQVFSKYFGFPCQSFHQFLHNHNHPGLAR